MKFTLKRIVDEWMEILLIRCFVLQLAEATAENHFQEKEIEEIKQKSRRKQ